MENGDWVLRLKEVCVTIELIKTDGEGGWGPTFDKSFTKKLRTTGFELILRNPLIISVDSLGNPKKSFRSVLHISLIPDNCNKKNYIDLLKNKL